MENSRYGHRFLCRTNHILATRLLRN